AATHRLLREVHAAVAAGVNWIQIREKELEGRELSALAGDALRLAAGSSTRVLINDRLDVAVASGAKGVHLGSESLPVRDVTEWCEKHFGPARAEKFMIGASCHSLDDAVAAERDGADYIFFGPVFATPAKLRFGPPQGLERLAEISQRVRIPVLAIGGVTLENAADCLRAGAAGIAAIRLFQEAENLAAVVAALQHLKINH
ncbi:MAG TPA: thiamine phosphate synthase, partial [Candidatus Nitrosotenuis sp.]|nr:thiamine phosphate synthase [Candidatus Nitrosotenuis sp.]